MNNESQAKVKLEEAVQRNVRSAAQVLERVMTQIPVDAVVPAVRLNFVAQGKPISMFRSIEGGAPSGEWGLHQHALRQAASIASIPAQYVDHLNGGEDWQKEMLAEVLTNSFAHSPARHLVRAVDGQARAVLSDKFRRLDSRPIFDAFVESARAHGAVPYSGLASDVRGSIKMIVPQVQTLPLAWKDLHGDHVQSEYLAFGVELSNSDFGAGALNVRGFMLRLICLNGAVAEDFIRKAHLGARLSDDIEYSAKTYELDTRAMTSAVRDVVRGALGQGKIDALINRIQAAQSTEIKWDNLKGRLAKAVSKEELRKIGEAFEGNDVANLPPGNTAWRASNAVSWVLQAAESADRRMELEKLAGSLVENRVEVAA